MLLRISLIVAILAGLGAGTLAYLEVSKQIPVLVQQRDDEKSAKQTALTQLANTNKVLVKTRSELVQTQQELADTKSERDKALASADAATRRADDLNQKLAKATTSPTAPIATPAKLGPKYSRACNPTPSRSVSRSHRDAPSPSDSALAPGRSATSKTPGNASPSAAGWT